MNIRITLSKQEQVEALKRDFEKTKDKYSSKGVYMDLVEDIKPLVFILTLKYPAENRVFNWQLFNSIKLQFKLEDKSIKVEMIK